MNWIPFILIFFFAVITSFYATDEFKPRTNQIIGMIGGNLLFLVVAWNFFANGWVEGILGILLSIIIYSTAIRSH